ncbi:MAG: response regulator [Arthrospira sp. PLM2.Bin9]|nr:response regulator [Arthrospira sp. PLM2.Bin9]TVU55412.1 MAG: response regulator [Arthrospira sp. PLM2.Bin9]
MKILIVEDDRNAIIPLIEELKAYHYIVDLAVDGTTGLELALEWNYDLIVLDWMLPGIKGPEICRQLREQGFLKPILLLTVRNLNEDIITGLDAGADDFVSKPYSPSQLLARIRALLRRQSLPQLPLQFTWENLQVNETSAQVYYNNKPVDIKPKAYNLLLLFLKNPQRIFSRQDIIDQLWSFDNEPSEYAVTNLIKDLRRTLKDAGMIIDIIATIYGLGYRLNPPPETEYNQAEYLDNSPSLIPRPNHNIEEILAKYQNSFGEEVGFLEDMFLINYSDDSISEIAREKAQEIAHNLAGSLGSFGYQRGSELARDIENCLSYDEGLSDKYKNISIIQEKIRQLCNEINQSPQPIYCPMCGSCNQILLIDSDRSLAEQLQGQAKDWNLNIEAVSTLTQARQWLTKTLPDAILLDPHLSEEDLTGFDLLKNIGQRFPEIPILIFTHEDNLSERIMSARLGARRFLHKPVTPQYIFEAIAQVLPKPPQRDSRIMIVEDDPICLQVLRNILKPWGFDIICLREPNQFWQVLTQTLPDLLILDVQMPTYTGLDLCQVVRQDPAWEELPILVVTGHQSSDMIQRVFEAGADDFITKPIIGPELVARVIARIERSQLRRKVKQIRKQALR